MATDMMKALALNIYVNAQTVKLKQFNKELDKTNKGILSIGRGGGLLGGITSKLFGFFGAYFGIKAINNMIKTTSNLQLMQASIEGLTKSTQDWQYVQDEAFRTGTKIEAVARGYKNFYSSVTMAGFDKKSIQGMYSDLLTASRAIGASQEQTSGALLALEQMISKGTVSMEELRRQLGNALPGAFEIGAKAMNMTTKEFNEFVKKGQLASNVFVPKFVKTLVETYGGGFEKITKTTDYALGQLGVAWTQFQVEIMSGETGEALAKGLQELVRLIRSPEFRNLAKMLGEIFVIIMKILSFLIRNGKLVLIMLGMGGFYGLLSKNASMLKLMNMEVGRAILLLLRMGKVGKFGFATMGAATKGFVLALIRVLAPLMMIEDLIFGIGHFLLGWDVGSVTRDFVEGAPRVIPEFAKSVGGLLNNLQDPYGARQINLRDIDMPLLYKSTIQDMLSRGDLEGAKNLIQNYKRNFAPYKPQVQVNQEKYSNMFPLSGAITGGAAMIPTTAQGAGYYGTLPNLDMNKAETEIRNLSMGDVNIVIQSSSDPTLTAMTVREELSNLFVGASGEFA